MAPFVKSALSRRSVIAGLGMTALLAGTGPRLARGESDGRIDLIAGKRSIEVNGRTGNLLSIARADGRQGLELAAGDAFRVRLVNRLDGPTVVHWHGLTPPSNQDGVPELSQPPVAAGASYDYDFPLRRPGTFWMHSHLGLQQQIMMAPLIVADPAERGADEQGVVMLLYDFSFRPPEDILAGLAKGGMAGMGAMHGMGGMGQMGGMGSRGHMMQDVNDVDYDAYLANDRTLADPDTVRVEAGGRLRLRIINAAAATNFQVDLGRLRGELVAVDGNAVVPLSGTRFELAIAQRIDVRLQLPKGAGAYPILALREGARERAGVVLATQGAPIRRLDTAGAKPAPVLGLALERRLAAATPIAKRKADRTHRVDLMGDMMSYVWTINGTVYGEGEPLMVKEGERVELAMRNVSMMSHPMHLHGHRFQVVGIGNTRLEGALRDTVLVPPGAAVTVAFDADNPGRWAFHCHNLYHMESGMMTELRYGA